MARDQNEHAEVGAEDSPAGKDRPGPADHGKEGGMATREIAPQLTEED